MKRFLLFVASLFVLTSAIADVPQGVPLKGDELTRRTQEISATLRCPVCQGLSIADSPSEMAINMRTEVRSMLERGYTREQIEAHFVSSYGEFVLLKPRNALVWILPVVALIAGGVLVVVKLRALSNAPSPSFNPRVQPVDPDLARVRELVKGASS